MNAFWIILTGSLVATSCGLLGTFLILRKMAMVGDAISHAVLPGIVIAYLLSESRDVLPMLIGAAALGVLTTFMIEFLYQKARLQIDASIGITFTWLFAMGIILISLYAGQVDLDQDCVLYGEIAYVPLDLWITESGRSLGPRPVWILGGVLLLILLLVTLGYRGLKITTFNPEYAAAVGISTVFWHYLLMSAVSVTTVVAFESVGAILVVAFLIVPPATAYLLTEKLHHMLLLTVGLGLLTAVSGYYLAVWIDGSVAGAMAVTSGVFLLLAVLFSPSTGVLTQRFRQQALPVSAEGYRDR
ncbi:metal ABC transporter permease [Phaeodactylibacter sp.]|jgi:manganese/zinc/iron transport system permease protein|uniref:metal ABC transporter permease n=1 Tax=Phaeodactylibacter sp. TaxID=1940289 RepID=UPI0025D16531|nr:metal ABC transporter permease [Phaeodactylibacter sp.]MCI4647342.1 metal ABC transporter permease [Phaeodactylibacter sp.]MCI5091464.1 metal ABC transporter permease [Phaeodactylibacter sp.]